MCNPRMNRFTFGAYMAFARYKYDVQGFFQSTAAARTAIISSPRTSSPLRRSLPVLERSAPHAGVGKHSRRMQRPPLFRNSLLAIQKSKADNKTTSESKELEGVIDSLFSKLSFGNCVTNPKLGKQNPDILPR